MEDNQDMRDLLALRVQLTGYVSIIASHGKEGVEKANAEKPDLILMDMMTPVMDAGKRREHFEPLAKRRHIHLGNNRSLWF